MKLRCKCARVEYRNLPGGTQERRIAGKITCNICRGTGCTVGCPECLGAGLLPGSKLCHKCGSTGRISAPAATPTVSPVSVGSKR